MTLGTGLARSSAMWWRTASWRARARRWQQPRRPLQFDKRFRRRVLIVSLGDDISQSQTHPFHYHAREIESAFGAQVLEMGLDVHMQRPELAPQGADVVMFQTWIGKTANELGDVVSCLRQRNPNAKLVFLDPFAPADLRYAAALGPHIDLYVKKHVLRDRSQYGQPTAGDTNLSDWYGQRYGLKQPVVRFETPDGFFSKLIVGPSFVTAPYMLPDFASGRMPDPAAARPFDLHARLGGAGSGNWYELMRTESLAAVRALDGVVTTGTGPVVKHAYLRELATSKICFSPFGYGEVCWRDYEAIHAGALLIKPDMSHIETDPDVFIAGRTYVPVDWDFANLRERVKDYLGDAGERVALSREAFATLQRYSSQVRFVDQMARVLSARA